MRLDQFETIRYYGPEDLSRWENLEFELVEKLDKLTGALGGQPFRILSTYRTEHENEKVGGAPQSQHLYGRAIDIVVPGGYEKFLDLAKSVGFTGIGLYVNSKDVVSAHLDVRPTNRIATWGKVIGQTGEVALSVVVQELKRRGLLVPVAVGSGAALILTIVVLYAIFSSGDRN